MSDAVPIDDEMRAVVTAWATDTVEEWEGEKDEVLMAASYCLQYESALADALKRERRLQRKIEKLKSPVVSFAGPWAAQYALANGLPPSHLHPKHYDILKQCGARMTDFVRHEPDNQLWEAGL